jgi:hypothetical protein
MNKSYSELDPPPINEIKNDLLHQLIKDNPYIDEDIINKCIDMELNHFGSIRGSMTSWLQFTSGILLRNIVNRMKKSDLVDKSIVYSKSI